MQIPTVLLKDVCLKIKGGGTPRSSNRDNYTGNIPFVMIDDMTSADMYLSNSKKHITDNALASSSAWTVPKQSLLYSIYATLGEVVITDADLATNQAILGIIPDTDQIDIVYLYYVLLSYKKNVHQQAKQGTQKNLTKAIVENFIIPLPPLDEQKSIANTLTLADDAIVATSEVIQQTEDLKRSLLTDLFNGLGVAEKLGNEDRAVTPRHWITAQLGDIASVERGKFSHRPRNDASFYGGEIPFIQTGDVVASVSKVKSFTQTLNEKGLSVSRLFPKGTIVMTIAANIGSTAILDFDACFPDSLVGITPGKNVDPVYLEYFLRTRVTYLNSIATQSAQKNINLEKLRPLEVLLPPLDEQRKIASALSLTDEKIEASNLVRSEQKNLKLGLMQDLLAGKVRVQS